MTAEAAARSRPEGAGTGELTDDPALATRRLNERFWTSFVDDAPREVIRERIARNPLLREAEAVHAALVEGAG